MVEPQGKGCVPRAKRQPTAPGWRPTSSWNVALARRMVGPAGAHPPVGRPVRMPTLTERERRELGLCATQAPRWRHTHYKPKTRSQCRAKGHLWGPGLELLLVGVAEDVAHWGGQAAEDMERGLGGHQTAEPLGLGGRLRDGKPSCRPLPRGGGLQVRRVWGQGAFYWNYLRGD